MDDRRSLSFTGPITTSANAAESTSFVTYPGPASPSGPSGLAGATFSTYRVGYNVSISHTSGLFSFTYARALPAGNYATYVNFHGLPSTGFSGSTTMPALLILTSTNAGLTFEIADLSGPGAVPIPFAASYPFDYITMPVN